MNPKITSRVIPLLLLALAAPVTAAGWQDLLRSVPGLDGEASGQAAAGLSDTEVTAGLREALQRGVHNAVTQLGRENGFYGDERVRIGLPSSLSSLQSTLGGLGLGYGASVDQFVLTMNRAAEAAVPQAAELFSQAVAQMSVTDAHAILTGPKDAATRYLRRTAGPQLEQRMRPIVADTTAQAGVTASYKNLLGGMPAVGSMMGSTDLDLDSYVTGKAVDGVFTMVAAEEARIRTDPAARGTELLRRVFGR